MSGPKLSELLAQAQEGDATAKQKLFRELRPMLRNRAAKLLGSEQPQGNLPSDLAQAVIVKLLENLAELQGESERAIRSYCLKLIKWMVLQSKRDSRRQLRDQRVNRSFDGREEQVALSGPTVSETMRQQEEHQSFWGMLARLTDLQRHALLLKYQGATLTQMAKALKRPPGRTSNILYRAIRAMKNEWKEEVRAPRQSGRVLSAFRQYLFLSEREEHLDRESFLGEHPQVADALRQTLSDLDVALRRMQAAEAAESGNAGSARSA